MALQSNLDLGFQLLHQKGRISYAEMTDYRARLKVMPGNRKPNLARTIAAMLRRAGCVDHANVLTKEADEPTPPAPKQVSKASATNTGRGYSPGLLKKADQTMRSGYPAIRDETDMLMYGIRPRNIRLD